MNEDLQRLQHELQQLSCEFGLTELNSIEFSKAMLEKIRHEYHGSLYIPKPSKKERNQQIRQRFNGVNHDALCVEFGLSKRRLYDILREGG